MESSRSVIGPLDGVRVLDIGTFLALGTAGALLSDFGAEVIKVEQPKVGDWMRGLGPRYAGESLRWKVVARNKKSITIDLRTAEGQQIVRDLVARSDVVLENYRPGTVDRWGLGYAQLCDVNPRIVMLSLSGYGQTGPKRSKTGFGRDIEAIGGWMHSTGFPDGPPVQMGVPLVDYITGLFAAMSVAMALQYRNSRPHGEGQWIDLSLYESVVRLTEHQMLQYDKLGKVPGRIGNRWPDNAPANVYPTRDGRYIYHGSGTQPIFERLMRAIGREDLIHDPEYGNDIKRTEHEPELDEILRAWFLEHDFEDAKRILEANDVAYAPVNTMVELLSDPQLIERQSIVSLEDATVGPIRMPGLVPKFSKTPGQVKHTGPKLGEHTDEILTRLLGFNQDRLADLRSRGVI